METKYHTFEDLNEKTIIELRAIQQKLKEKLFKIRNEKKYQEISFILYLEREIKKELGPIDTES